MKRNTFRLLLILGTIALVGITIAQMFWVKQTLSLKEKEFNYDVTEVLKNVAIEILHYNRNSSPLIRPVKQLEENYFVVTVNDAIDPDLLEGLLKKAFHEKGIFQDYEYIIYDCVGKKVMHHRYISVIGDPDILPRKSKIPVWEYDNYYFGIFFPAKSTTIINKLDIWAFATIISVMVLLFFAYALFIILKQRRLSEIQKEFVNNMTHEFKTPIATICISASVIKDPAITGTPERLSKYAGIIEEEAMRLKNQVERILQMASLEKDSIQLKIENIDLSILITDVVKSIYFAPFQENINFEPPLTKLEIKADRLHLSNVLFNLLDNAVKYTSSHALILIKTEMVKKGVLITVQDNGMGIKPKFRNKIFEAFYRVPHGNVHNVKGFGLGLNYVKTIIQAHGGSILYTPVQPQGSRFSIFLPL